MKFILIVLVVTHQLYPSNGKVIAGTPASANAVCNSLSVVRTAAEQTAIPFVIGSTRTRSGKFKVVIEGRNRKERLQGFVLAPVDSTGKAVNGTFSEFGQDAKITTCNGVHALTHTAPNDKRRVRTVWIPSLSNRQVVKDVQFKATVARNSEVAWPGLSSRKVNLDGSSNEVDKPATLSSRSAFPGSSSRTLGGLPDISSLPLVGGLLTGLPIIGPLLAGLG